MAILTSMPGEGDKVGIYDIPDDVLGQYAVYWRQSCADVSGEQEVQRGRDPEERRRSRMPSR